MADTKKYVSLENLQLYDSLNKQLMAAGDAKSLKTVSLDLSTKTLHFYRVEEPVGTTEPAYSIELPETDLSGVVAKMVNATTGNVVTVASDGGVQDSGVAFTEIVTTDAMTQAIANAILQAPHMKKALVDALPDAKDANGETWYIIKDDSVTGRDKYQMYLFIDGQFALIDDTTIDLSGYSTTEIIEGKIATAKSEAINEAVTTAAADATAKADAAVDTANQHADEAIGTAKEEIKGVTDAISGRVTTNETNINTINQTLDSYDERIDAVEAFVGSGMSPLTEDEIKVLFPTEG